MKKRFLSTLLAVLMVLSMLPGTALAATGSGMCGNNVSWSLDSNGTLTISGSGPMYNYGNYYPNYAPWYAQREDIRKVEIESGVTTIGDYALYNCKNMTSATVGDGIVLISKNAFYDCTNLTTISLPASISTIQYAAFIFCNRLRTINYGGTEAQWNTIEIHISNYANLFASGTHINYVGSPNTSSLVSGTCGDNITWSLDIRGTLSITGTGMMYDYKNYSWENAPWYHRREEIVKATISDGITSIGQYAFNNCKNLTSISLPDTLGKIDSFAFYLSSNLKSIYYAGTQSQWNNINIAANNNQYLNSSSSHIYYNSTGPIQNFTVKFDPNYAGGSTTSKTYIANTTLGTLPTTTRTGYTFNGWYTAASGGTKVSSSTKVTSDMTLYAHWTKNTAAKKYTVTFNANGGTVSPKTKSVTSGSTYGTLPTPTRSGYKFSGWYTGLSTGTKVLSTTKVNLTKNQTLYARWTKTAAVDDDGPVNCIVTFNPNGGKGFQLTKTVLKGSRYRDLPTPTKNGYHFLGWYTSATAGTRVTSATKVTKSANHTLYAHWSKSAVSTSYSETGRYTVYVPPYCKLPLYATQTTATQKTSYPAKSSEYAVQCTQMVELSNGTVRYYGKFGTQNYWFQFTSEMDAE